MKKFFSKFFLSKQDLIEAYLAQSTSLHDLERRQQDLMRNRRFL